MHRLIQQLQEEGFVRVDINGTIVPASRTRHMAIHLWQSQQVAIQRFAILQRLVDKIGETCGMAVPYYVNMVYTDRVPCPSALPKCICPLIRKHPFGVRRLVKST